MSKVKYKTVYRAFIPNYDKLPPTFDTTKEALDWIDGLSSRMKRRVHSISAEQIKYTEENV